MKRNPLITSLLFLFIPFLLHAGVMVGENAPDFTVTDSHGKTHTLSDFEGKIVVLEWMNVGCPFIKKHYNSGNMQKLQKKFTEKGVIWLSVASSGPGKQGYLTLKTANNQPLLKEAKPTALILDENGEFGKLFGATNTPHFFIIDKEGKIAYNGAIDDIRSTNVEDVPKAKNYVKHALKELLAGKSVSTATTQPYGCSVKYKD